MTPESVDAASVIALASSVVGLAYALVQGPLSNVGWMRAAKSELELSEMLGEDGDEGRARRMLRERATRRVIRSWERAEALSSGLVRFFRVLGIGGLAATGVFGLIVAVMMWMGRDVAVASYLYVASISAMSVGSIGGVIAQHARARRLSGHAKSSR